MMYLAPTLTLVLWLIAGLHAYWGFGGVWPAADTSALARTVVGARGLNTMPPLGACVLVAALLIGVGIWPLFAVGLLPPWWPPWLLAASGAAMSAVFLARGLAAYLSVWRRRVPEQPFATLDRQLFGPLCLALGISFATLTERGLL